MSNLIAAEKEKRFLTLNKNIKETFIRHNDVSYNLFNTIKEFSALLPDTINGISILSDMITDAIVVSGRSSFSKSANQLSVLTNTNINFDTLSSTLTLDYKIVEEYLIDYKKSRLTTLNKYNLIDIKNKSVGSYKDFFNGVGAYLITQDDSYNYTFKIDLVNKKEISCIELALTEDTESYPVISEIYYINEDNKKVYLTILNSNSTSYDLDLDRVKQNTYRILFPSISTNKLYFSLQDINKSKLGIKHIKIQKLEYNSSGSIVLGPIVSNNPILKASIEAAGTLDNATFYLSTNKLDWIQIAPASTISFNKDVSKILALNTINPASLKDTTDFKQLYLKIDLLQILDKNEYLKFRLERLDTNGASSIVLPQKSSNPVVYKYPQSIFYGDSVSEATGRGSNILSPQTVKVEVDGKNLIRGFIETDNTILNSTNLIDYKVYSKSLRTGADDIKLDNIDPSTIRIFGYSIITTDSKINTSLTDNIIFTLKSEFSKDIYSVRQNNKEIQLDLSCGYVGSTTEVILTVDPMHDVYLLDSTGKVIKELEIKTFEDFSYINLLEADMFNIPECDLIFNPVYPLKLNSENEYSLSDNKIISSYQIINFKKISNVYYEHIEHFVDLNTIDKTNLVITNNLLKNKYTESGVEFVQPYQDSNVIKLKNKFIKKGSLNIEVVDDEYIDSGVAGGGAGTVRSKIPYINPTLTPPTIPTTPTTPEISAGGDWIN